LALLVDTGFVNGYLGAATRPRERNTKEDWNGLSPTLLLDQPGKKEAAGYGGGFNLGLW
jgi:hypothetical protein